jgi:hypothetical protein
MNAARVTRTVKARIFLFRSYSAKVLMMSMTESQVSIYSRSVE